MKYIVLLLTLLMSGCEDDKVIRSENVEATIYRIREVKSRYFNYRELELKTNDETPIVKGIVIKGQCKINPRVIGKTITIKKELTSSGYIRYHIPSEVSTNVIFTYCW